MKYEAKKNIFYKSKKLFIDREIFSKKEIDVFFEFINLLTSKSALKKIKENLILKIKLFNDITIYEK